MAPFGLDDADRQRVFLLVLLFVGGGYAFWQYVWSPLHEERVATEDHLAVLEQRNAQARALTQPGRIEELRRREAEYQVALAAYETMLPSEAEVAGLLEEVARSALTEGVEIVNFAPLEPIDGEQLVELPYDVQVQGTYHDIGRFVASVANMPRLVRPGVVALEHVAIEQGAEEPAEHEVLATFTLSTFLPAGSIDVAPAGSAGTPLAPDAPRVSDVVGGEHDAG